MWGEEELDGSHEPVQAFQHSTALPPEKRRRGVSGKTSWSPGVLKLLLGVFFPQGSLIQDTPRTVQNSSIYVSVLSRKRPFCIFFFLVCKLVLWPTGLQYIVALTTPTQCYFLLTKYKQKIIVRADSRVT